MAGSPTWANGGQAWNYPPTDHAAWTTTPPPVGPLPGRVAAWESGTRRTSTNSGSRPPTPLPTCPCSGRPRSYPDGRPGATIVMGAWPVGLGLPGRMPQRRRGGLRGCHRLPPLPRDAYQRQLYSTGSVDPRLVEWVRSLIAEHTTKPLQIWLTEFGWTTCTLVPPGVSEDNQAAYLLRSILNYAGSTADKVFLLRPLGGGRGYRRSRLLLWPAAPRLYGQAGLHYYQALRGGLRSRHTPSTARSPINARRRVPWRPAPTSMMPAPWRWLLEDRRPGRFLERHPGQRSPLVPQPGTRRPDDRHADGGVGVTRNADGDITVTAWRWETPRWYWNSWCAAHPGFHRSTERQVRGDGHLTGDRFGRCRRADGLLRIGAGHAVRFLVGWVHPMLGTGPLPGPLQVTV